MNHYTSPTFTPERREQYTTMRNASQRQLVLTGQPEFWPDDERDALYLAPWCFAGHQRHPFWRHTEFEIAPSPWQSGRDFSAAARYVDDLCDRLLPPLAELLNRFHGVRHGERFWKIVALNWLLHWVSMCHDRYQRLCRVRDACRGERPLHAELLGPGVLRIGDWPDFTYQRCHHGYNLQLISDIIRASGQFDSLTTTTTRIDQSSLSTAPAAVSAEPPSLRLRSARRGIKAAFDAGESFLLARIPARCSLRSIYGLSRHDKLMIQLALDPFCLFKRAARDGDLAPHRGRHSTLDDLGLDFSPRNDFEQSAARILCDHLPDAFLSYWPASPRARAETQIWLGNDVYTDIRTNFRIAHIVESGGAWISAQHGCSYGQNDAFPLGKLEYETASAFTTWGWSHRHLYDGVFVPLPSPLLSKLERHRTNDGDLLFVGTTLTPYLGRFQPGQRPGAVLPYLQMKREFLEALGENARAALSYRPYIHDYGVDERAWITEAYPNCRFATGGALTQRYYAARLIVIDHPGTTLLETLACDAPTIAFWDPGEYPMTPAAQPFFDALRAAGILFDAPREAALRVNQIWHRIRDWWIEPGVQRARDGFARQFARTSRTWRREWTTFVRNQLRARTTATVAPISDVEPVSNRFNPVAPVSSRSDSVAPVSNRCDPASCVSDPRGNALETRAPASSTKS